MQSTENLNQTVGEVLETLKSSTGWFMVRDVLLIT